LITKTAHIYGANAPAGRSLSPLKEASQLTQSLWSPPSEIDAAAQTIAADFAPQPRALHQAPVCGYHCTADWCHQVPAMVLGLRPVFSTTKPSSIDSVQAT